MSLEQPDIYFVLTQFRSSYPSGALLTELLQIHQDKFLVRATVQIDGMPLATGMASASVLELAEDQARIRALGVLGIYPLPKVPTHLRSSLPYQPPPSLESSSDEWAPPSIPAADGLVGTDLTPTDLSPAPELNAFSTLHTPLTNLPSQGGNGNHQRESFPATLDKGQRLTPKPKSKSTPLHGSEPDPASVALVGSYSFGTGSREQLEEISPSPATEIKATGPIDLSDIIAQTSIEVERLGWTPDQGKQYLKQAYGKESRQLLTPDELMSFLSYLKLQDPPL